MRWPPRVMPRPPQANPEIVRLLEAYQTEIQTLQSLRETFAALGAALNGVLVQ